MPEDKCVPCLDYQPGSGTPPKLPCVLEPAKTSLRKRSPVASQSGVMHSCQAPKEQVTTDLGLDKWSWQLGQFMVRFFFLCWSCKFLTLHECYFTLHNFLSKFPPAILHIFYIAFFNTTLHNFEKELSTSPLCTLWQKWKEAKLFQGINLSRNQWLEALTDTVGVLELFSSWVQRKSAQKSLSSLAPPPPPVLLWLFCWTQDSFFTIVPSFFSVCLPRSARK